MFCRKCGKELSDNAKFCNRCGTPVIKDNKEDANLDNEIQQQKVEVVHNIPVTEWEESNNYETDNVEQTNVDDNKETEDIEQTDINDSNKTDNLEQDEVDNNKETEDLEQNNLDSNKETDDSEKTDQEKLDELLLAEIHRQYEATHPNEHNEETDEVKEANTDNKEKSDNSAETDNNDSDETATENYAAYYRPTENPTNSENSNAKSTTNEVKQPEDNEEKEKFVYEYSTGRMVASVLLTIFVFLFAFNSCVIFAVRNLVTKTNVEDYFINVDVGNFQVTSSNAKAPSDGTTVVGDVDSLGQHVMDLMGDEIVNKYEISETEMTDFLSDEEIETAIGDIYYYHLQDVLGEDGANKVTSKNFVNIFKNHASKVEEILGCSFDDKDYEIMDSKFTYGFLQNMPTSIVLYAKYPIKTIKILVSSKMLWLNICLFIIFSLIILLINKLNLHYTSKFVIKGVDIAVGIIFIGIIIGLFHHGTDIFPIVKWTFLLIIAGLVVVEGIDYLKEKARKLLDENDDSNTEQN